MQLSEIMTKSSDFDALMSAARARTKNKQRIIQNTPEAPTGVISQHGNKGYVGPDQSINGKFRFSYFNDNGRPSGHTTHDSFKDALITALDSGFSPTNDLFWEVEDARIE